MGLHDTINNIPAENVFRGFPEDVTDSTSTTFSFQEMTCGPFY